MNKDRFVQMQALIKIEKTCLFCKHFRFESAQPNWSDITPGDDLEIYCGKYYWKVDNYKDTRETYRKRILTAKSCVDYEFDIELLEGDD